MRLKGTLVEWNDDRGFGFLEPAGGGERPFWHISQVAIKTRRPKLGERLTYALTRDERGRLAQEGCSAAGRRSQVRRKS